VSLSHKWIQPILAWTPALLMMGLLFWISANETPNFARTRFFGQDKMFHACAYFGLACLYLRGLIWGGRTPSKTLLFLAIAGASLYGATDEYHQSWVPERVMGWEDWCADTLGASMLLLAQRPVLGILARERKRYP